MLAEILQKLQRRYSFFSSQRSKRGFQLLPPTALGLEFVELTSESQPILRRDSNLSHFYNQNDGFESATRKEVVANSEEVAELVDTSQSFMSPDRSILLGFIGTKASASDSNATKLNSDFSSVAYNEFKREDSSLDTALAECNRIRMRPAFSQGLLLKSVEPNPMFSFIHYAIFNLSSDRTNTEFVGDLNEAHSLFGVYEELFTIQKSATFIEPSTLPTHRHAGFIVSNFKIMDGSRQQQLEKNWLYWSGAKEIYRYSPRAWNLRKISLLRIKTGDSFAYILLCEYGQILHPSNLLLAMDMCERLRARVCGNFNLYRVQHNYYAGAETTKAGIMRSCQPDIVATPTHSLISSMSPSPNSPATPYLMSPSKMSHMELNQDMDLVNSANLRRSALYRIRDRSLGYETRFHSYQMFEELT